MSGKVEDRRLRARAGLRLEKRFSALEDRDSAKVSLHAAYSSAVVQRINDVANPARAILINQPMKKRGVLQPRV